MHKTYSEKELNSLLETGGATLTDLAALYNVSVESMAGVLRSYNLPLPSMALKGPFDLIKNMQKAIRQASKGKDLVLDVTGRIAGLPDSVKLPNIDIKDIYENVHGASLIDPYNDQQVTFNDLKIVNGDPSNFLVTNLEFLSEKTWKERFDHPIGLTTEIFDFNTKYFDFSLTISRKYDQLVGGTYSTQYVQTLMDTWVINPLCSHFNRDADLEQLFIDKAPTAIAWWTWYQLTNFGFLKGLTEVKVRNNSNSCASKFIEGMRHTAVLTDKNVIEAIFNSLLERDGAPRIVTPQQLKQEKLKLGNKP